MKDRRIAGRLFATALVMLWTGAADAQWVLLARRVIGRVESMQQTPKPGMPIYDAVSVVLEAQVGKIYRTVVQTVQSHPENRRAAQPASADLLRRPACPADLRADEGEVLPLGERKVGLT